MKKSILYLDRLKKILVLFLALLFFHPSFAQAHCRQLIEKWTLLDSSSEFISECTLSSPLSFKSKNQYYPAMGGIILNVNYWEGSFSRDQMTTNVYLKESFDCHGRIQSKDIITQKNIKSKNI